MAIQPISAIGRDEQTAADQAEGQYSELLAQSMKKRDERTSSLTEMIRDAKEKADAQREKFKLAKATPRYGDAPLEAYARISRARTQGQASSAAGYARRRISQLEAAQRSDPDHADQIRAAVSQLKKAVSRANKKKLELSREQLSRARQKRLIQENKRREAQRIQQELRKNAAMRAIRESGYFQETEIANRQADQLTATKMELRMQAEQLGATAQRSLDAAVQGYSSTVTQIVAVDMSAPVSVPQVNVQA
ncbi:MAG: hypothetical protein K2M42_10945 [Oscillospiraceae bacterium]|nr:hypothetical protein [Oscillospiraceae bacterium]